jgi:hypothetical protein
LGSLKDQGFYLAYLLFLKKKSVLWRQLGALVVVTKAMQDPDHIISSSKLMLTSHGWERGHGKSVMHDHLWNNIRQNCRLKKTEGIRHDDRMPRGRYSKVTTK